MKKSMVTLLAGVCMAALLAGGCANKEAVKKEEAVVPATSTTNPDADKLAADEAARKAAEEAANKAAAVTPAQEEAVSPQAQIQAPVEVSLESVYFDFDKSDLRQDARDILSKNAELILKSLPTAKIQIAGHTDERGSAEYNLALGERRAKSAQKYLTTLGVNCENLSLISYGKEKPPVDASGEAAWAKSRRADFSVVK